MATIKESIKRIEALKQKLTQLKNPTDRQTAQTLGEAVIEQMKGLVSKGISPISGKRFPGYKNQGTGKGYPYSVASKYPSKKDRPVNLFLSGDFMNSLDMRIKRESGSGYFPNIGFYDSLSKDKERGHRDGANGQPERPIIPEGSETFSQTITRIIASTYRQMVRKILK